MRIKIFQIDSEKDVRDMKFKPLGSNEVNPSIYRNVYFGDVDAENLEEICRMFNGKRPATHQGHSLSVSDIVEVVDGEGKVKNGSYFCDRSGFKDIDFDGGKCEEMEGIDVVYVTPGHTPIHIRIRNTLEDMQNAVGGLIEPIYNEDQTVSVAK